MHPTYLLSLIVTLHTSLSAPLSITTAQQIKSLAAKIATAKEITFGSFVVPANFGTITLKLTAGCVVQFTGTITFEKTTVIGSGAPYLIFAGANLLIKGTGKAVFDGNGAKYWDGKGAGTKPRMIVVGTTGSRFQNFKIKNTPAFVFSIHGANNIFELITIDNRDGDKLYGKKSVAGNTDGFDVSGSGNTIQNCVVYNQDDCLAINAGTGIIFQNNICYNGHGISIGSMRQGKVARNIKILNNKVINSDIGFRIKGYWNEAGTVDDVTVTNLEMSNITKYGVMIIQDYAGGPSRGSFGPMFGQKFTNIKMNSISGTLAKSAHTFLLFCGQADKCKTISFANVKLTGGLPGKIESLLVGYEHVLRMNVQWGDMDMYGHVNNVMYFKYFESGRVHYFQKAMEEKGFVGKKGAGFVLKKVLMEFKKPLFFPDEIFVCVKTDFESIGKDEFIQTCQIVSKNQERIVAKGKAFLVFFDFEENKKTNFSEEIKLLLKSSL